MSFFKNEKIQITVMYILFIAGGLWHILGWFQTIMTWLASPLLIILALVILVKFLRKGPRRGKIVWAVGVIIFSFCLEWVGVRTGRLFGHYQYGNVLHPVIQHIPIAIGFSWFSITLSSLALAQRFSIHTPKGLYILIVPLLMVLFDILMEPAATALNYWTWDNGKIPLLNYLTWYGIGVLWLCWAHYFKITRTKLSNFIVHTWFSQAFYFLMIYVKILN